MAQLTLFSGPITPPVDPRYDHVWYWGRPVATMPPYEAEHSLPRCKPAGTPDDYEPQRKGRRCRVRCRGRGRGPLNVAVEMADGELVCAPRWAVRRAGGQGDGSGRDGNGAGRASARAESRRARPLAGQVSLGMELKLAEDAAPGQAADPARAAAFERELLLARLVAMGCRATTTRHHQGPQQAPLLLAKPEPELSPKRRERAYQAAHGLFWREILAGE